MNERSGRNFQPNYKIRALNNEFLSVIVNKVSNVFGPSIQNLYKAGDDLGLMIFELLGFFIFLKEISFIRYN